MKTLESQLQSIGDRAALHKWVDDLPDRSMAVLIVELPNGNGNEFRWHHFGDPTMAQMLWIVETFKQWLLAIKAQE